MNVKKSFINKPEVIILRYLVSLLLLFLCINGHGQGSRVFLDPDYYHLLSRYEILQGQQASEFDSNVKTYQRTKVRTFLDSLSLNRTVVDKFNLQYLLNDNWPFVDSLQKETNTAFLRYFYRRPSDFWHVQTKGLLLRVNPVLYFGVGADDREGIPYVNRCSNRWSDR